jgi:hypothetical protein
LLQPFRQNTALAAFLTVVLAVLLKFPVFLHPHSYAFINTAPLSNLLFSYLNTLPTPLLISYIISTTLLVIQAILLNYITVQHGVLYKDSYLPGLFFVLLGSLYPEQAELTPQLISNTFILLLFQRLCFLYESLTPLLLVLDAGIYLGTAILFNYDVALFLPFILISVVIFTSFNIRYLITTLLGVSVPLYFAAIYFYMSNQLSDVVAFIALSINRKLMQADFAGYEVFLPLAILVPIILVAVVKLQANFFRNKVKTRRILQCLALLFVFGGIGLFIENTNVLYSLFYMAIPVTIVTAYYFINNERRYLKDFLFLCLIALSVYYQLF